MRFILGFSLLSASAGVGLSTSCSECVRPTVTIDFEDFEKGDKVSHVGYGVNVAAIKIVKRLKGTTAVASPMIFDTSNPTGGDVDLGTPNEDFGGPGVGVDGKLGASLENSKALGNVLIISEDENSAAPDDSKFGGTFFFTFNDVKYVESIGFLDHDVGSVSIELFKQDNTTEEILVSTGGDNGYEEVMIDRKLLTGMNVHCKSSCAITHVNLKGRKECGPCVYVYKVCGFKNDPVCKDLKQQCEDLVCSIRQQANADYECSDEYEPWP